MQREVTVEELRARVTRFQGELAARGIAGAVIAQNVDRYYFSGTMQGGFVVVPPRGDPLVLVRKDARRAAEESPLTIEPLESVRDLGDRVRSRLGGVPSPLGFELDVLPAAQAHRLQSLFPGVEFADASPAVLATRALKSPFELEKIRRGAGVVADIMETVPRHLREGVTEIELAARLECELRLRGHGGLIRMRAFNQEMFYGYVMAGRSAAAVSLFDTPIGGVGLGPAVPRGPSKRPIGRGEPVVVDLIGNDGGYLSDMSRFFSLGVPPEPFPAAFEAALAVEHAVVEEARPGVSGARLYEVALEAAYRTGFSEHFMGETHKVSFVGHGLGLEVDEPPFLARGAGQPLAEGMVFALEPKFVFADQGVIGIEDTYVVTSHGVERLTASPRGFRILDGS